MPAPTPYNRQFNFEEYQALNPATAIPGVQVDIEFNAVKITLDQTINNLGLIQRADGVLANRSVGFDQLKPELSVGTPPAQVWSTATVYSVGQSVFVGFNLYRCVVAHTSGVFATDLAAGKWVFLVAYTPVEVGAVVVPVFGGRLTAVSGQSVQITDVLGAATIYYTPHEHGLIGIYDGSNFANKTFSEMPVTLDATNWLAGKNYDFYVFDDIGAGVRRLGYGPAWTSDTARGSGAGTTEITRVSGVWVNAQTITLRWGPVSTLSVPINRASYVGSGRASGNSQCSVQFHPTAGIGGTNPSLGLFNAYNRKKVIVKCQDSTSSWTHASSTVRPANGSTTNRINFIDGLGEAQWRAVYVVSWAPVGVGATATTVGIALDNIVNFNGGNGAGAQLQQAASNHNQIGGPIEGSYAPAPTIGFHYVQAMEQDTAVSVLYFGNDFMMLRLETEF